MSNPEPTTARESWLAGYWHAINHEPLFKRFQIAFDAEDVPAAQALLDELGDITPIVAYEHVPMNRAGYSSALYDLSAYGAARPYPEGLVPDDDQEWKLRNYPVPAYAGELPNLSAMPMGTKRFTEFERVMRMEADNHWLHREWDGEEQLRDKVLWLIGQGTTRTLKVDDPIVMRTFTMAELERAAVRHKAIARLGDELIITGIGQGEGEDWESHDGGTRPVKISVKERAVLTVMYLAEQNAAGLSARQMAAIINRNKATFGLEPGVDKDISPENIRGVRKTLRDRREIREEIAGHAYLINRYLAYCPAVYSLSADAQQRALDQLESNFYTLEAQSYQGVKVCSDLISQLIGQLIEPRVKQRHRAWWARARAVMHLASNREKSRELSVPV